jgi:hypothetical protein
LHQPDDTASLLKPIVFCKLPNQFPQVRMEGIRIDHAIEHGLRCCCGQIHLVRFAHPQHAVSQWLGHSERVSKDHYLMVTSEAFKSATTTETKIDDSQPKEVRAKVRAASSTHGPRKEILDGDRFGEKC